MTMLTTYPLSPQLFAVGEGGIEPCDAEEAW